MITDYKKILVNTKDESNTIQRLFFINEVYWASGSKEILIIRNYPAVIEYDTSVNKLFYSSAYPEDAVSFQHVLNEYYRDSRPHLILPYSNILVYNNNDLHSLVKLLRDRGYWSQGLMLSFDDETRGLLVMINEPDRTFKISLPYVYSMDVVLEGFDVL